ncbi:MAG: hypothetical protein ACOCU6_02805 [Nanoarchaeota archaeon]
MDIERKTIVVAVVFAVCLSLASLLFSLVILPSSFTPTAYATNNGSGQVTIEIPSILSVSLTNATVDFGSCAINLTKNYSVLDSSMDADAVDNDDCTGGAFPSFLTLVNKGNTDANIRVRTNYSNSEFFQGSSDSWYAFKILNDPDNPGCVSGQKQDSYRNFSSHDSYLACDNFSAFPGNDAILLAIKAVVYENTTTQKAASITFEARDAVD